MNEQWMGNGQTTEKKYPPATVPFSATPAGEPPSIRGCRSLDAGDRIGMHWRDGGRSALVPLPLGSRQLPERHILIRRVRGSRHEHATVGGRESFSGVNSPYGTYFRRNESRHLCDKKHVAGCLKVHKPRPAAFAAGRRSGAPAARFSGVSGLYRSTHSNRAVAPK